MQNPVCELPSIAEKAKFVNKAIPLPGYPIEALGGDRIFVG
jgi:hypothetical protein